MLILFCAHPLEHGAVDDGYEEEANVLTGMGIEYALMDLDALVNERRPEKAVRALPAFQSPVNGVYRGWMLKPEHYAELYESLHGKNIHLINDPLAYRHCHYLPESYPVIESHTARTVWTRAGESTSTTQVMSLLSHFGSSPVIVKDYVKSQKHYWNEACFISDPSDARLVEKIVSKFLRLQGEELNVGLVFREFIELESLTVHRKSNMPMSLEFRVFFLDGQPIISGPYWDDGIYKNTGPELEPFLEVAQKIKSRFFTMDIAKTHNGGWIIIELGDGQVSDLPPGCDTGQFYRLLKESLG